MKINPGWRPIDTGVRRNDSSASQPLPPKGFADLMDQQRERTTMDELQQRLQQIAMQGDRLAKSMTVRELRLYKQMVKSFLEETVRRGVGLKETKGWDRRGRTKRYQIIEEIDRSLLELAEELLTSEQGKIQLLNSIGDIRGLLINLLF
ncbi:YaaR family protein [Paenibacillus turpanensis]|uniref:YaaR family protein n=1 Tax=Paenibacillus turpanensis TaxID=2689078 RepID=UPI00140C87EE|nr:YaaR family protein [Paenibacillus turpanensis]